MLEELEDDRFGVVLISSGSEVGSTADYYDVGTEARIVTSHRLPDGRSVMMVVGERRFEVLERLSADPYPLALVEYLGEGGDDWLGLEELRRRTAASLRRALGLAVESGERVDLNFEIARDPVQASYQVASLMRISDPERQELLELPTAQARLERELAVLAREIELLERLLSMGRPK